MRIITGLAKGIQLKSVKGLDVRPTADRVKQSVFNILENLKIEEYLSEIHNASDNCLRKGDGQGFSSAIYQAKVLDLFAGTGNLGLEALSRGAESAVFVDRNRVSISVIMENIRLTKMISLCEIIKLDVFSALNKMDADGRAFNLVFADPPYDQDLAKQAVARFDENNLLAAGGILLVEHSKNEIIDYPWRKLTMIRKQQYGQTMVSILINNKKF